MRDILRLRHYAYRTEQTYLDWVKQFYIYLENTRKKTESSLLNGNEVKNFLSYLALNRKVSASTQNQAFSALLFLFHNVLNIDLGEISKS